MPLGRNFNDWLKETGKEPLSLELESVLDDIGREIAGDEAWKARVAAEVAFAMGKLLGQEYKLHEGAWWLFSLGKPARPLSDKEVAELQLQV